MLPFLLCIVESATIRFSPNVSLSVFNKTEGYEELVRIGIASSGASSEISGFAKSIIFIDENDKPQTAAIWFIQSGTKIKDPVIVVFSSDSTGLSKCILGPVTQPNIFLIMESVVQPIIRFNTKLREYELFFFSVQVNGVTFNRITRFKWEPLSCINEGVLHIKGKQTLSFDEDYVIHAFIPNIGPDGIIVMRQPLMCVPSGFYWEALSLISFDISTRTFSQVSIPGMFPGRNDKWQDPYYSFSVDYKGERVILVSRCFYQHETDIKYRYISIPFMTNLWRNEVAGVEIPNTEASWFDKYFPNVYPNNVTYDMSKWPENVPKQSKMMKNKRTNLANKKLHERQILFYQDQTTSMQQIRTTTNGFYFEGYASVPYQLPYDWGVNGSFTTIDIPAGTSKDFKIRMIKIDDVMSNTAITIDPTKDNLLSMDLSAIAARGFWSDFLGKCQVVFMHPPILDSEGNIYYMSEPLLPIYRCRQNFVAYSFSLKNPQIENEFGIAGYTKGESESTKSAKFHYTFSSDASAVKVQYPELVRSDEVVSYDSARYGKMENTNINHRLNWVTMRNDAVYPMPTVQINFYTLRATTHYFNYDPITWENITWFFYGVISNYQNKITFVLPGTSTTCNFRKPATFENIRIQCGRESSQGALPTYQIQFASLTLKNSSFNPTDKLEIYSSKLSLPFSSLSTNVKVCLGNIGKTNPPQFTSLKAFACNDAEFIFFGNNLAGVSVGAPDKTDSNRIEITEIQEAIEFHIKKNTKITFLSDNLNNGTTSIPESNFVIFEDCTLEFQSSFPFMNGKGITLTNFMMTNQVNISMVDKTPLIADNTGFTMCMTPESIVNIANGANIKSKIQINCQEESPVTQIIYRESSITIINSRKTVTLPQPKNSNYRHKINNYMKSNTLILSVDPSVTKLVDVSLECNDGSKLFIDDSWFTINNVTLQINVQGTPIVASTTGKIPTSIIMNAKCTQATKPSIEEVQIPSNVCIDFKGETKCGSSIDEIDIGNNTELAISVDIPQTIKAMSLENKSIEIKGKRSDVSFLVSLDCQESQYNIPFLSVSEVALSINSKDNVTLKSDQIDFSNLPTIVSSNPVILESPNISIGADLLERIDEWKGVLSSSLPSPTITSSEIKYDSNVNVVSFTNTGLTMTKESKQLSLTQTGKRNVTITGNNVDVTFPIKSATKSILSSASSFISTNKFIDMKENPILTMKGNADHIQISSIQNECRMNIANPIEALYSPSSKFIASVKSAKNMGEITTNLKIDSKEGEVTHIYVGNNEFTIESDYTSFDVGMKSNITILLSHNITLYAKKGANVTTPINIEAESGSSIIIDDSLTKCNGFIAFQLSGQPAVFGFSPVVLGISSESQITNPLQNSNEYGDNSISGGAIAGIVIGVIVVISAIGFVVIFYTSIGKMFGLNQEEDCTSNSSSNRDQMDDKKEELP